MLPLLPPSPRRLLSEQEVWDLGARTPRNRLRALYAWLRRNAKRATPWRRPSQTSTDAVGQATAPTRCGTTGVPSTSASASDRAG